MFIIFSEIDLPWQVKNELTCHGRSKKYGGYIRETQVFLIK
jgi:hypothetical protein